MIHVTKTYLPPLEEYQQYLKEIWQTGWITNHGALSQQLQQALAQYFNCPNVVLLNNGTIALQIAVKMFSQGTEVVTTPFSYVATTSSIVWEGFTPVFADIDPNTLNIDPARAEAAITPNTAAILATHVYGNACDVEALAAIAKKHNIALIYDAAHAFGCHLNGKALVNYGHMSTLSFHATKLFHTVEGGAIITNDNALGHQASYMRNFGHNGQEQYWGLGVNGKISELHAAMGLLVLPKVNELIERRRTLSQRYDTALAGRLQKQQLHPGLQYNYAYYPVLFASEEALLNTRDALHAIEVQPRRYFYPSLTALPYVQGSAPTPIANEVAKRVLCLPLYYDLPEADVDRIAECIIKSLPS